MQIFETSSKVGHRPYNRLVDGERGKRFRSFLIGGLVGSAAGLAAGGRLRVPRRPGRWAR